MRSLGSGYEQDLGRRHEVIVHCIQRGAEHDERSEPLDQTMIQNCTVDMKSLCIASI